jgi:hypothetical protein
VGLLNAVAMRLAKTNFGKRALAAPLDPGMFKQRPSPRVLCGLVLTGLSLVVMWPALGVCGYLAASMDEPLIIVIGGPVVVFLAHLMFALGVYLAGSNYAKSTLSRATKLLINRYGRVGL